MLLLIRAGLSAPPRVPGLRLSKAPLQVKGADRLSAALCHTHGVRGWPEGWGSTRGRGSSAALTT